MQALFLTSQRLLTEHWPTAARLLESVLGACRGEFTIADLEELCREGRAVAGVASDESGPVLAMVFEFRHYPRFCVLNVIALAGHDMQAVAESFWPTFVSFAAESGAAWIEASTSPAMARLLRPLGFGHTYNVMRLAC